MIYVLLGSGSEWVRNPQEPSCSKALCPPTSLFLCESLLPGGFSSQVNNTMPTSALQKEGLQGRGRTIKRMKFDPGQWQLLLAECSVWLSNKGGELSPRRRWTPPSRDSVWPPYQRVRRGCLWKGKRDTCQEAPVARGGGAQQRRNSGLFGWQSCQPSCWHKWCWNRFLRVSVSKTQTEMAPWVACWFSFTSMYIALSNTHKQHVYKKPFVRFLSL